MYYDYPEEEFYPEKFCLKPNRQTPESGRRGCRTIAARTDLLQRW